MPDRRYRRLAPPHKTRRKASHDRSVQLARTGRVDSIKNAQRQEGEHVKQKRLVTAIKGIIGAELVLSAAFIPMAHAQTTDQSDTGGASGTSTTSAAAPATAASSTAPTTLERAGIPASPI